MKSLQNSINESQMAEYDATVIDVKDREGLPVNITITVDMKYHKEIEKWIENMLGNEFGNACGVNVDFDPE